MCNDLSVELSTHVWFLDVHHIVDQQLQTQSLTHFKDSSTHMQHTWSHFVTSAFFAWRLFPASWPEKLKQYKNNLKKKHRVFCWYSKPCGSAVSLKIYRARFEKVPPFPVFTIGQFFGKIYVRFDGMCSVPWWIHMMFVNLKILYNYIICWCSVPYRFLSHNTVPWGTQEGAGLTVLILPSVSVQSLISKCFSLSERSRWNRGRTLLEEYFRNAPPAGNDVKNLQSIS